MVAILYRMLAGFAGDVNRTHPASIEPTMNDVTNPVVFYGQAGLYTATGTFRSVIAGDSAAVRIDGVSVRPFPIQQMTANSNFGQSLIGAGQVSNVGGLDILKSGYIMVPVNGTPVKGGAVFVWVAATASPHVQGGFEQAASAGNTAALGPASYFNSGPDASGVCELAFNVGVAAS